MGVNMSLSQIDSLDDNLQGMLYDTTFINKLVEIAWANYPGNKVWDARLEIAKLDVKKETWSWLNALNFNYIYYPDFLNSPDQSGNLPSRVGIGITINIGTIFSLPLRISQAKENYNIAENNVQSQYYNIRYEVQRRYFSYLSGLRLYNSRVKRYEDARSNLVVATYKYKNGEIDLDFYNKALTEVNINKELMIESETNMKIAKASLEELILIKLEEVK